MVIYDGDVMIEITKNANGEIFITFRPNKAPTQVMVLSRWEAIELFNKLDEVISE